MKILMHITDVQLILYESGCVGSERHCVHFDLIEMRLSEASAEEAAIFS